MILVTGGAGFIGSVLVRMLNQEGRKNIVVVDKMETLNQCDNLKKAQVEKYITADDFLKSGIDSLQKDFEFIFHIGACSSTTERDVEFLKENNVNYSKKLWNMAVANNTPYIYASSAATYGDGENGYDDNHDSIDQLKPLNPYGWSKQYFDQWVLQQENTPPRWFGLKYFNVFGPNEYHKQDMRSLVHKGFEQIKEHQKIRLFRSHKVGFEDGEQLRDFVYVKDVCRAMLKMIEPDCKAKNGIYNLGTGKERSFKDLAKATFKAMGVEENIEYFDMPESIRNQYQYFTKANMEKFHSEFPGFEFSDLEEAVADYVQNYLMKEDSYL